MMSKKQFFIVLCVFIVYILVGATIFHEIERREEETRIELKMRELRNLTSIIGKYQQSHEDKNELFDALEIYCGKPVKVQNMPQDIPYKWDFYHSLFFVITVVSTIGYGNLAPTTTFSRIFMIFYGLIGIPINGIVMVTLGDFYGKSFKKLYSRWKNSKRKEKNLDTTRLGLIAQIVLYLVPGFTFFIFVPSIIIMAFEEWEYDVAVYYAFVTLTTIGFGDIVAGVDRKHENPFFHSLYQLFLLVWIIGGLGYVVMILNFIAKGMRSKKLQALEQKITSNIIKTPSKIRQELRAMLQEFLMERVHKVYKEFVYNPTKIDRSQSCPDLTIYRNMNSPSMTRKRAFSECPQNFILQRIQSDTDLSRIDKDMTFQETDHHTGIILKVMDAFSDYSNSEPECYEGLSDREILASESYNSEWSLNNSTDYKPKNRSRTRSEVRYPYKPEDETAHTWYGHENVPTVTSRFKKSTRSNSVPAQFAEDPALAPNLYQRLKNTFYPKTEKNIDLEKQEKSYRVIQPGEGTQHHEGPRRASVLSLEHRQVLEQTSMADFIRAITALTETNHDTFSIKSSPGMATKYPQRPRRMPIRPNQSRRSSLIPSPSGSTHNLQSRRSSVATVAFNESPRYHPRKSFNVARRFSLSPVKEVAPPPYTPFPDLSHVPAPSKIRKFSVKPTSTESSQQALGPVQRYTQKREKNDSQSSDNSEKR